MRNEKLVLIFLVLSAIFISKAEASIFSDNFDDEDITDWIKTTQGSGVLEASMAKSVSALYSFHMNSPGNSQAMAVSPLYPYNLDLSENYHVSFSFLIPHLDNHWFEVFNNQQVYVVIDSGAELKGYLGEGQSKMIKTLDTDSWYDIELRVHQDSNSYDFYINN